MRGPVPRIHVFLRTKKDVDGRDKHGHDETWRFDVLTSEPPSEGNVLLELDLLFSWDPSPWGLCRFWSGLNDYLVAEHPDLPEHRFHRIHSRGFSPGTGPYGTDDAAANSSNSSGYTLPSDSELWGSLYHRGSKLVDEEPLASKEHQPVLVTGCPLRTGTVLNCVEAGIGLDRLTRSPTAVVYPNFVERRLF